MCVSEGMKTITAAIGLAAMLALPAAVAAEPSENDHRAAQKECKQERGATRATREAFKFKYHSMSRCVRRRAADEEDERGKARSNAAHDCKAERKTLGAEDFADEYGTNRNKRNAYGKCVSEKATENKADMDAKDDEEAAEFRNAAKRCAAERRTMGDEDFAEEYGTNRNKRNAFGKCVSRKADDS
jgi:hypothetical protein